MRSALLAVLLLATPVAASAQDGAPLTDDPALAAALDAVTVEQRGGVPAIPEGARALADGAHHAMADGRTLYVRGFDSQLWEITLRGAERLPAGTRLVPITDLSTVRFASLPDSGYALLVPGQDRVFVADFDRFTFALPIERVGEGASFERTERVRAMRACPRSRSVCALVGSPRAVAAAEDPLAPNHGWELAARPPLEVPPGLTYRRSMLPTSIEGASLVVDVATLDDGARVERVYLRLGGRTQHAFDQLFSGVGRPLEPRYVAVAMGQRVYVHDHGGTVSVHARATGRRIDAPHAVGLMPYYDVCRAGDEGFMLTPVLSPRRVSFAMVTMDGDAFVFDALGGQSVHRSLQTDSSDDAFWDLSHLEPRGRRLVARNVPRR